MNIDIKKLTEKIEQQCTKDILMAQWLLPVKSFLIKNIDKSWGTMSVLKLLSGWDMKKNINKADLVKVCAQFYSNEAMVTDYYNFLSPLNKAILEKATWNKEITRNELEAIYGSPVLTGIELKSSIHFFGTPTIDLIPEMKEWAGFINLDLGYDRNPNIEKALKRANLTLTLSPLLRETFANYLPKPKGYYLEPSKNPTDSLYIFNVEKDIFRELPIVITYYMQGNLKYSQKGYPNVASARKMAKTLKLQEFQGLEETFTRASIISGLFSDDFKVKSIVDSPAEIIKSLFAKDFNKKPVFPFMLTHLKGLNYFYQQEFQKDVTQDILGILKRVPEGEWVTFENLTTYIQTHFIKTAPLTIWEINYRVKALSPDPNGEETTLHSGNLREYVEIPNVAGHLFLAAAFGLLELAIDPKIPFVFSLFDGIVAFRMTDLGAYVFGLTKEYLAPQGDYATKLSFDETSNIIRIEGDIVMGDTMLANYATKVSENRYQFSPGKFLKECRTTKDLQNKIVLFKQTVGQKLPVFWENYLQQLVTNSKLVEQKARVQVFTLPPDNKDLHRIVAQDEVLRKIVIKAEQFHLLVFDNHIPAFLNRMKELGYLLG